MIDPELQPFLDAWNDSHAQLAPDATIQQRRDCIEKLAQDMRLPTPSDIDAKTEHWIESRPRPVRARVFRHKDGGTQPCLIYMHGGSFMVGSPETVWDSAAAIASRNRQTVICIAYDKAPEHPFPAAIHQCAAVVEWAFDNAADLGIDPDRIAIGGESAGASLAAALGLPYAFASHFAPGDLDEALALYRARFQPTEFGERPRFMLAVNVIAADTDEQAQRLRTSQMISLAMVPS